MQPQSREDIVIFAQFVAYFLRIGSTGRFTTIPPDRGIVVFRMSVLIGQALNHTSIGIS